MVIGELIDFEFANINTLFYYFHYLADYFGQDHTLPITLHS